MLSFELSEGETFAVTPTLGGLPRCLLTSNGDLGFLVEEVEAIVEIELDSRSVEGSRVRFGSLEDAEEELGADAPLVSREIVEAGRSE